VYLNKFSIKKNHIKILRKKQIKTTRVSSAFRRKKINGARKEIFLNEKKTVMHDVEL
jgi:hypothetical protein